MLCVRLFVGIRACDQSRLANLNSVHITLCPAEKCQERSHKPSHSGTFYLLCHLKGRCHDISVSLQKAKKVSHLIYVSPHVCISYCFYKKIKKNNPFLHFNNFFFLHVVKLYRGTPLIRTLRGQAKLSVLTGCPY